jgi:acyltransferase
MASQRLTFIDILRGIACVWMIETHAVNAFLNDSFTDGMLYNALKISNGFVAVTFIFCAGAGFRLALESKLQDYISFGKPLWKYISRLLFILGIGYSLQTPIFSFDYLLGSSSEEWMRFLDSNVLQLIVVSSFLALIGLFVMRSLDRMMFYAWPMMVAVFWLTPIIWSISGESLMQIPDFLRMYVSTQPPASFPLFPWTGYYFAGYIATHYFVGSKDRNRVSNIYLIVSIGLMLIVYGVSRTDWTYYSSELNWWLVSPMHMMFRVSGAMFLFALLYKLQDKLTGPVSGALMVNGRESLVVYVGQGIILYGAGMQAIIRSMFPEIIMPWHIVLLTISVIGIMTAYAFSWNTYKKRMPMHAKWTLFLSMIIYVLIFLLTPA